MSELMQHATDDQMALAFCFAGVFVSGLMMYFSFYLGQKNAQSLGQSRSDESPIVLKRPETAFRQDKAA